MGIEEIRNVLILVFHNIRLEIFMGIVAYIQLSVFCWRRYWPLANTRLLLPYVPAAHTARCGSDCMRCR